jgi:hypothetical protein
MLLKFYINKFNENFHEWVFRLIEAN